MQLYRGGTRQFVDDAMQNRIAGKLEDAFFAYHRYRPGEAEVRSWRNSLSRMCLVVQHAGFLDHGVLLEYQLPLTSKRLDCLLTGRDASAADQAVIVELKQWDAVERSAVEDCVTTRLGGRLRDVLHPSCQVGRYKEYLEDCHTAFHEGGVGLAACSYLHNLDWRADDEIFSERHRLLLERYPTFAGDRTDALIEFLEGRIGRPDGGAILDRIAKSRFRPAKKLLDHTAAVVRRQKTYVLLDEQQVVFNTVLAHAQAGVAQRRKHVVLVRGGPGTGKSVIALHLIAELCDRGFNAQHATGAKAFTENVRKLVGSRASALFKYFNGYGGAEPGAVDVLVLDEAHRIRKNSNNRFTPKSRRTTEPQIDELLRAAKVLVVFIDDLQVVRPDEVGSSTLIREAAARAGATLHEFELEAQFRCAGSDGFVNWVDNTLGVRRTANVLWDRKDPFEFRLCESAADVESRIRARAAEGHTARMVSGYCWPWSHPREDGSLVSDVVVGDWSRPWNARPDSTRLAPGIPKSLYWASDPTGIEQVGCVYTAQGFEFDYVGVIFGPDLRYDAAEAGWVGDRKHSYDSAGAKRGKERFIDLVRQTYRVLLTRGMKGCYLHVMDRPTRDFVRSRIE